MLRTSISVPILPLCSKMSASSFGPACPRTLRRCGSTSPGASLWCYRAEELVARMRPAYYWHFRTPGFPRTFLLPPPLARSTPRLMQDTAAVILETQSRWFKGGCNLLQRPLGSIGRDTLLFSPALSRPPRDLATPSAFYSIALAFLSTRMIHYSRGCSSERRA